jgi:cell division protein FtsB
MRSEANGIRSSIQAMQSENDQLRAQIEQMNQDGYVERIAREQLGLVKANETSYVPAEVRDLP